MTVEKQGARLTESLAQRLGRVMLVELPVWQLLILAAVVGIMWAASIFDWSFVTGRSAFWQFPGGTSAARRWYRRGDARSALPLLPVRSLRPRFSPTDRETLLGPYLQSELR